MYLTAPQAQVPVYDMSEGTFYTGAREQGFAPPLPQRVGLSFSDLILAIFYPNMGVLPLFSLKFGEKFPIIRFFVLPNLFHRHRLIIGWFLPRLLLPLPKILEWMAPIAKDSFFQYLFAHVIQNLQPAGVLIKKSEERSKQHQPPSNKEARTNQARSALTPADTIPSTAPSSNRLDEVRSRSLLQFFSSSFSLQYIRGRCAPDSLLQILRSRYSAPVFRSSFLLQLF